MTYFRFYIPDKNFTPKSSRGSHRKRNILLNSNTLGPISHHTRIAELSHSEILHDIPLSANVHVVQNIDYLKWRSLDTTVTINYK